MNGKTEQRASSSGARATTTSAHAHDSVGHTPPPAVNALGGAVQGSSTEMICTSKLAHSNDQRSWSDLPTELVGHVLGCLPAHIDRIRFAAVCHHWCISARHSSIPPPLPWLVLSDGAAFTLPRGESFQIPNSTGFHSCSGEWLVFSTEKTCSLVNTFSKANLKLPDLHCFNLIDEPHQVINGHEIPNTVLNTEAEILIWKIVVCSEILVAAMVKVGDLYTLALCRPGAKSWFVSALGRIISVADMMFYGGKLYTVDDEGDLCSIIVQEDIDSGKLRLSRIERVVTEAPFFFPPWPFSGAIGTQNYLVESCGALLLVRRRTFEQRFGDVLDITIKVVRIEFEVLEANFKLAKWVKVTSVGDDQVLFVGRSSQSICVSRYRQKGNCIFFLEDIEGWNFEDAPSSYAIYDMKDGTLDSPLPRGSCKGKKPPATWLFPR
ncbi:hypothetical protein QYE76_065906 [Lolium multiflorum]|uniref:DUF295 domain-containing protein n=1 Tax=Lolium multiflorum TaxID=4521 RepID=A0AAD8SAZ8_LOLMU|nr:hypothetical protein QYE76_065906 [Lolium multiflorum]